MPNALSQGQNVKKAELLDSVIRRHFSHEGVHPFDEISWKKISMKVRLMNGSQVERELEFPEFWSENAAKISGSKYFRGRIGSAEWESSARQMVNRVAQTIKAWGLKFGHLKTEEEAEIFGQELTAILINQRAAFNSPVWFNMGMSEKPQCSACFILAVEDTMDSILEWISTEGVIFKRGSGSGINLSPLRSNVETLSQGGHASGPVSFMRGADSVAGMIAAGGSTRRAAKMVVLNIDHPDIESFVAVKAEEEKIIRALIEGGFNMYDLNNPAWHSVQYQNANNSVRVTDEFMNAVENDETFSTRLRSTGGVAKTYKARDLMSKIAQAAWECGDPGMQFDTTANNWHTAPNTGRINASNPCSEYMHLDNSACNLASINLMKYLNADGSFAVEDFIHTVDIMILAQEILVDGSSYPTEKIAKNAHEYRQLGLGYANLGALLMSLGYAYDSEEARHTAGAITALMTGEAYRCSAEIAARVGTFEGFEMNREPMLNVLSMHRDAYKKIRGERVCDPKLYEAAGRAWDRAVGSARKYGVRNSQATVLAPTGTIALMMDCATTGIEPEFALVKTKSLIGGGTMRFVNTAVPIALKKLGYDPDQIIRILEHIEKNGVAEGCPDLLEEHQSVFDCAVAPRGAKRFIAWQGHVKMVAAAQPFISGAISKTFNMPHETGVEEIANAYTMGWKMGLKAFAVYRDGSKATQPLSLSSKPKVASARSEGVSRRKLPATRPSETHKFSIAGHEGYLTYSMYEDGTLAELFVRMHKQGSTLSGLLDVFAITVSVALQSGVPLKTFAKKFSHGRFEPAGFTENPDVPIATSITDYIFRYLAIRFLAAGELEELGIKAPLGQVEGRKDTGDAAAAASSAAAALMSDTPATSTSSPLTYADSVCKACGGMLIQTGTCKTCISCGTSNGGC
jgi:ribonucleoside-diphosphate reductase alpha chain